MTESKPGRGERSKQVLRVLAEHGPLTSRGLSLILSPKISERRLREVLKRLGDLKYITAKEDQIFRGSAKYYRLTRDSTRLKEVSYLLHSPDRPVIHPYLREREHLHSETCAVWMENLRRWYPDATFLREHHYSGTTEARTALISHGRDSEYRPDLIMIAEPSDGLLGFTLGIEIERNRKSSKRLIRKLYRYTNESRLDGVLYLCSSDDLAETLRDIYNSRIRQKALRIGPYGNNFFVFAALSLPDSKESFYIVNATRESISFDTWIATFRKNTSALRRDSQFKLPAATGW